MRNLAVFFLIFANVCLSASEEITYVRPIPYGPGSLIISDNHSETEGFIYRQIFDSLFLINNAGELIPNLAVKWEILEGGLAFKIHVNRNASFHDGSPLKLADIDYSLKRTKGNQGYIGTIMSNIASIVLNENEYSVLIKLKHPNPLFLNF